MDLGDLVMHRITGAPAQGTGVVRRSERIHRAVAACLALFAAQESSKHWRLYQRGNMGEGGSGVARPRAD